MDQDRINQVYTYGLNALNHVIKHRSVADELDVEDLVRLKRFILDLDTPKGRHLLEQWEECYRAITKLTGNVPKHKNDPLALLAIFVDLLHQNTQLKNELSGTIEQNNKTYTSLMSQIAELQNELDSLKHGPLEQLAEDLESLD